MKAQTVIALSLAALVSLMAGLSQIPAVRFAVLGTLLPLTSTIVVKPLKDDVYWVSGGMGNTGLVIGETGVIAIDSQMFIPTAKQQLEEMAKITPKSVKTIVLTHSDPDHVNGLPAFPRGLEIIAHDRAKADMQLLVSDLNSNGFPPSAEIKHYMPTRTVKATETTNLDGVPVILVHTGSAHTDGDLAIFLPRQRVVFAGDLLTPAIGPFPGIHLGKHGSSLGMFASLRAILALDADIYVPGHGEPLTQAAVRQSLKDAEERRAQVKTLFDQGKSVQEAKLALNDVALKGAAARFPTFVETTYQELIAERGVGPPAK